MGNNDLGNFLEAMSRYARDVEAYYQNCEEELGEKINADTPSWRVFADILRGARIYE